MSFLCLLEHFRTCLFLSFFPSVGPCGVLFMVISNFAHRSGLSVHSLSEGMEEIWMGLHILADSFASFSFFSSFLFVLGSGFGFLASPSFLCFFVHGATVHRPRIEGTRKGGCQEPKSQLQGERECFKYILIRKSLQRPPMLCDFKCLPFFTD